jgi:hypothetical protein
MRLSSVQNADTVAYWLMSASLDPDYFSPLEAAYAFHGIIGNSVNKKIDDHFRVMNFRNPIAPGTNESDLATFYRFAFFEEIQSV